MINITVIAVIVIIELITFSNWQIMRKIRGKKKHANVFESHQG